MRYLLLIALLQLALAGYSQTDNYIVSPKKGDPVITVGGAGAFIQGFTNQAIQLAVDALPQEGGTVQMGAGTYRIMAPVRLRSNVTLIGQGDKTILKRIDGFRSAFTIDADYGELKVTVADASGFDVGMSIQITDEPNSDCWDVSTAVITDIVDNTLYFDTHLIRDYVHSKNGMVTNAGSCVAVMNVHDVNMANFVVDGNKDKNDLLDGCNGGGIAILRSKNVTVENVQVKDFNGEGITWQITENVTIRKCEISGCTNMGLHPGTGSPNSVIEGNKSHDNRVGLFICWRVHHSVVKDNQFYHNREYGISTGHKDTDVLFEKNHIYNNGSDGVILRNEDEKNSPHRNTFKDNIVENNGQAQGGYGFYIDGKPTEVALINNVIRDTGKGTQKAAVYVTTDTPEIKNENNTMSGHPRGDVVYEKKGKR